MVSQQATPNFIPALDSRFRPKEVFLLVSKDMRERARWLESALRQRAILTHTRPISDPWDVAQTQNEILDLLVECADKDVALNVTGGTKPMAIAAQEVFRAEKRAIFYVHPEQNRVVPLFSDENSFVIEERIKLADHLSIHGFHELQRDVREFPERYYLLAQEWINEVERFAKPLRTMNHLAGQARDVLRVALERQDAMEHARELVEKLGRYGLAQLGGNELVFPDEDARFFANGGWLELHVARVVEDLSDSGHIQDIARSLKVESEGKARNEIDVAVLAANRLYLLECKTKQLSGTQERGPGADMLYKLDSLSALGGLNTRGAVVSFQPLERWDRQRAKDLRIRVIEGGELRNLAKHLKAWMELPS
jgi:hypothetical protein